MLYYKTYPPQSDLLHCYATGCGLTSLVSVNEFMMRNLRTGSITDAAIKNIGQFCILDGFSTDLGHILCILGFYNRNGFIWGRLNPGSP